MDELKKALTTSLTHVKTIWFDQHDNWYIHKVPTALKSMTREEILGEDSIEEPKDSGTSEESTGKKHKKK